APAALRGKPRRDFQPPRPRAPRRDRRARHRRSAGQPGSLPGAVLCADRPRPGPGHGVAPADLRPPLLATPARPDRPVVLRAAGAGAGARASRARQPGLIFCPMATHDTNLADRSGTLLQSHKNSQPRVVFFYFVIVVLLLTLAGGLAYQQLINRDRHRDTERMQNQRRILVPGPRGNIYDREGRMLVGNRARFAAVLYLDELRPDFRREFIRIRKNYRETGDVDLPTSAQLEQIARTTVVQRYLDQVNDILHRAATVDRADLMK